MKEQLLRGTRTRERDGSLPRFARRMSVIGSKKLLEGPCQPSKHEHARVRRSRASADHDELAPFDVGSLSRERALELIREGHQVRRVLGVHPLEDLALVGSSLGKRASQGRGGYPLKSLGLSSSMNFLKRAVSSASAFLSATNSSSSILSET
jgi:hypothetical protein